MITLRQDQADAVTELRHELRSHQSVLMCAAPGWGKTVLAAYMAQGCQAAKKRYTFGVHRRELARQTAKTFDHFGIRYGFVAANMRSDPYAYVQIASHASLMNRPHLWDVDFFAPDEAHLWGNGTRAELISEVRQRGSRVIPLTGTPEQGSGVGLSNIADKIVFGPPVAWLIQNGHLARYRAFAPVVPDLSGLHTRQGEYVTSELEERFSKPAIYGDQVAAWRKHANGLRTIGYCYSRKHGEEMAATFRAAGISAAFIDGETPDDVRVEVIKQFAAGRISVLFNCQLFREGFDLSAQVGYDVPIQAVLLCAPTKSLPLAVQMMMRAMRKQQGFAVLIDCVNLFKNHGFPDDERTWTLEGVPAKDREAAIATVRCPSCFATFKPKPKCSACGHRMELDADLKPRASAGRVVAQEAGEIEEIDVEAARQAKKYKALQELHAAQTLPELVALAKARANKPGWVIHVMKSRGKTVTYDAVVQEWRK